MESIEYNILLALPLIVVNFPKWFYGTQSVRAKVNIYHFLLATSYIAHVDNNTNHK